MAWCPDVEFTNPLWIPFVMFFFLFFSFVAIRKYPPKVSEKLNLKFPVKTHKNHIYDPSVTFLHTLPYLTCLVFFPCLFNTFPILFYHWAVAGFCIIIFPLKLIDLIFNFPKELEVDGEGYCEEFTFFRFAMHLTCHPDYKVLAHRLRVRSENKSLKHYTLVNKETKPNHRKEALIMIITSVVPRLLAFNIMYKLLLPEEGILKYLNTPWLYWYTIVYAILFFPLQSAISDSLYLVGGGLLANEKVESHHFQDDDNKISGFLHSAKQNLYPMFSTSPKDFWGNRWNQSMSKFFKVAVFKGVLNLLNYDPETEKKSKIKFKTAIASLSVFFVSGFVHELMHWATFRNVEGYRQCSTSEFQPPKMETLSFFMIHGFLCLGQVLISKIFPFLKKGFGHPFINWLVTMILFLWTLPLYFYSNLETDFYSDIPFPMKLVY